MVEDIWVGVIGGGLATLIVQNVLYRTVWDKEIREQIYFPLLDELHRVRDQVNNFFLYIETGTWNNIRNLSWHYRIPTSLRDELSNFYAADLHNFTVFCRASNDKINNFIKEDLMKRKKDKSTTGGNRITDTEENRGYDVNNYPPFDNIIRLSSFIIRKVSGTYYGNADAPYNINISNADFQKLKKHFDLKEDNIESYVDYVLKELENEYLIKSREQNMKNTTDSIDKLIDKIASKTNFWEHKINKIKERLTAFRIKFHLNRW